VSDDWVPGGDDALGDALGGDALDGDPPDDGDALGDTLGDALGGDIPGDDPGPAAGEHDRGWDAAVDDPGWAAGDPDLDPDLDPGPALDHGPDPGGWAEPDAESDADAAVTLELVALTGNDPAGSGAGWVPVASPHDHPVPEEPSATIWAVEPDDPVAGFADPGLLGAPE
jgi:hypothetical protein